mmetsp:Transcript_10579/g.12154  ORF Transcript_10579/g.12154 Transcript_10579/m.12154 type:complete len:93 (-) Transcript_10579:285-563(-)
MIGATRGIAHCGRRALAGRPSALSRVGQTRSLHKNKFCEEWNGLREDTHKSFSVNGSNSGRVVLWAILAPAIMYIWSNEEEHTRIAKNIPKC